MSGQIPDEGFRLRNKEMRENDRLLKYISDVSLRQHPSQKALANATKNQPREFMLSDFTEMQFLANLTKLIKAKKTIDVGVYSGYSSLSIALALPDDGKVVALDIDDKQVQIGKQFWKEAGMEEKIDFRLGPAVDSLEKLLKEDGENSYDFAFIDADKENYLKYYELCLKLIRPGGIIAIDNVLWQGKVADPQFTDGETQQMRDLNDFIHNDERVDVSMLLLGDGTTLAFKR